MKQVMPLRPIEASLRAKIRPYCALSAPEMNVFSPLRIQSSPRAHRGGADGARRIAAAGGLGEAEEAALLAAQRRVEVALLLIVVGLVELGEAGAAEDAVAGRVESRAVLRHLDRHQRARDDVDPRPAVLLRNVEPVEPHRLGLRHQAVAIGRLELARVGVEVGFEREDLLAHEAAHGVDHQALFVGGVEVHEGCRFYRP